MSDDGFFGTDGIRDVFGEGRLAPGNVVRIGRAIARFAIEGRPGAPPRVFVGRDTRPSGPDLLRGIAEGMAAEGLGVEDGGVLPTPAIAWWTAKGRCDVGVALTASHNPAPYNGVKVFLAGGRKTSEAEEANLDAKIHAASPLGARARVAARPDAAEAYVAAAVRVLGKQGSLRGLRLVVDAGNGATLRTAPVVLAALGADVRLLPVEGTGINEGCGTEHPEAWRRAIVASGADGGLAFDGDGDRVLLADAEGEVLDGDPVLHLLARDLKARRRLTGGRVVATVMSNLGLEKTLARAGIRLERVPVGDRHVAARMRETGAALGGEQSGHVLLSFDGALVGDGLVAGVLALLAARRRRLTLAKARREVPRYPQVLRNVRVARRTPLEDLPALSARIREEEAALHGNGRVLVRYSGTEPLLRIMVEGMDAAAVKGAVDRLEEAARSTS